MRPQQRLANAKAFLQIVVGGDNFDDFNVGSDRLAEPLDALIKVECAQAASNDADLSGAAKGLAQGLTLDLARGLVVGPDVHEAVTVGRVGIESHHNDALAQ